MKSIVPFVAKLEKSEIDKWVKVLKKKLKGARVVKFSDLKKSEYSKVEVAVVANPNPSEVEKLVNLKWVQSIWVGVEKLVQNFKGSGVKIVRLVDPEMNALLVKHDSTYGIFPGTVVAEGDELVINGKRIKVLAAKDPAELPWGAMGVDIVVESTGIFTDATKAAAHRTAGAKKVIISAPAKNEDVTIVLGVNDDRYDPLKHHIISNASCTTNCLAPAAKVVMDAFGIRRGLMTTMHSYTNDQRILDVAHKDPRRARAAGQNMIPTTTGAATALALVIPELKGKFDGYSVRVPTPTVSLIDFTAELERPATIEQINDAFRTAASGPMKGILGVSDEPLVSSDFRGDSRSAIIDSASTMLLGDNFAKVVAWYDNEWGYSNRLVDLALHVAK